MTPGRLLLILTALALAIGAVLTRPPHPPAENSQADTARLRQENLTLTTRLDVLEDQIANLRARLSASGEAAPEILTAFVEKDLGLTFATPPVFFLATEDELFDAARQNLLTVASDELWSKEETVWRLLGLLGEDRSLGGDLLAASLANIDGTYLLSEDRILLPETFSPDSVQDQATLVRLLARKTARQLSGLPPEGSTFDRWRAWEAAHLGTALDCEKRYLRRRSAEPAETRDSPAAKRETALLQLSPAAQALANFPRLGGLELANRKYLESRAAFTAFLKNPPETTHAILFPDTDPGTPATAPPGPLYLSSLGALGLRTLLDPILGLEESNAIAKSWRNDIAAFTEEIEGNRLLWRITLSSPENAAALAAALEKAPSLHPADRHVSVTTDGPALTLKNNPK